VSPLVLAVPTFKSEPFLAETLASLNAQGDRVRWWLQDGASPDRTVEIARQYARPGDTVISEPDSGQTDALNRALPRMGGEIIGFLNGDDCLVEGAAERVLRFFAEHPEIDLVYGEVEWIDAGGQITGHHAGRIDSLEDVLRIYDVWWSKRQWVQPEVFFRRALWERVGGFDTAYHLAFDYDFWVRCFLAGARAARLPHPLARFRLHAAQKSTASECAADEIRAIVQKHLAAGAPLSGSARRRLRAQLEYDLYATGKMDFGAGARPSFAAALLRHPSWLLCAAVRERIGASLRKRLPLG
jgi:GT2 family glycosyltransferase